MNGENFYSWECPWCDGDAISVNQPRRHIQKCGYDICKNRYIVLWSERHQKILTHRLTPKAIKRALKRRQQRKDNRLEYYPDGVLLQGTFSYDDLMDIAETIRKV